MKAVCDPVPVKVSTTESVAAVTLLNVIHSTATPVAGAVPKVSVLPDTL